MTLWYHDCEPRLRDRVWLGDLTSTTVSRERENPNCIPDTPEGQGSSMLTPGRDGFASCANVTQGRVGGRETVWWPGAGLRLRSLPWYGGKTAITSNHLQSNLCCRYFVQENTVLFFFNLSQDVAFKWLQTDDTDLWKQEWTHREKETVCRK